MDLLNEVGMLGGRPAGTPIEANLKLQISEEDGGVDKGRYQRLVGKLIYLSHTRPYIAFVVSYVSRFMKCPRKEHVDAVNRILRYLKTSPGKGISYKKQESLDVEVYTDSD